MAAYDQYKNLGLFGTYYNTLPIDQSVINHGPCLSEEHVSLLSAPILMDCLSEFKKVSGLDINSAKSNVFTAGVFGPDLDALLNLLNFPSGNLPVRYLGVPLAAQKLNNVHYAPLYDRIAAYINKWTANSLTYAGRLLLIKSVLQGVECFLLQIFPLPKIVVKRIYRLCRTFLWGKKRPPISWHKICMPSDEGGLGIRNVYAWNKALLSKNLWNFHLKTDSLWVKWVHAFYLKRQSIWDWNPKKDDSTLLKRINDVKNELLRKFGNQNAVIANLLAFSNHKGLISSKIYDIFRDHGEKNFWKAAVWKSFIPPKYSFCAWMAFNDRLATINNLTYTDINPMCKLCSQQLESAPHLFFTCPITNLLWNRIKAWLKIHRSMSTLASAIKWIRKDKADPILKKARAVAFCCSIYHIWKARNAHVFDGDPFSYEAVFKKIQFHVYQVIYSIFPPDSGFVRMDQLGFLHLGRDIALGMSTGLVYILASNKSNIRKHLTAPHLTVSSMRTFNTCNNV
ncbi:hypothetical protein DH2020_004207 [Rehmannia glutinosa]|uniref:Reverse transcriptase zinc-binding domain-containing protein n=1 Tax=Rehmannia glutinosa TaxID=99300 RepID=A0ABR0XNV4_REHGL